MQVGLVLGGAGEPKVQCANFARGSEVLKRVRTRLATCLSPSLCPTQTPSLSYTGLVVQYASFATGPEALALKRVLTGLADRLGGLGSSSAGDAMEVDGTAVGGGAAFGGTPAGAGGGGGDCLGGGVMGGGPGVGALHEVASPPQDVVNTASKGKGVYAPQDYMSPMRVDVERIADVGMPTAAAVAAAGMAPGPAFQMMYSLPATVIRGGGGGGGGAGFEQGHMGGGTHALAAPMGAAAVAMVTDVPAASRHVSLLVYRLQMASGPEQERDAWQRLTECAQARQAPGAAWEGSAAQLKLSLSRALRGGAVSVRRAATALLSAMASAQPVLLQRGLLAAMVPALLAMAAGMAAEAAEAATHGAKDQELGSRLVRGTRGGMRAYCGWQSGCQVASWAGGESRVNIRAQEEAVRGAKDQELGSRLVRGMLGGSTRSLLPVVAHRLPRLQAGSGLRQSEHLPILILSFPLPRPVVVDRLPSLRTTRWHRCRRRF